MPIKDRKRYLRYQRKYQRTTGLQKRRERFAWLDQLKAKPCEDCGGKFPPECMDFDHRRPAYKRFNVSQAAVSGVKVSLVKKEIKKCRLICANCHRIRTAKVQRRYR